MGTTVGQFCGANAKASGKTINFQSRLPCFTTTILQTNLTGYKLRFPSGFSNHITEKKGKLLLEGPYGKTWEANYYDERFKGNSKIVLSGGWVNFARDNWLNVGDVCAFELLPGRITTTVRVSIFRSSKGLPLTGYEEWNHQSGNFNFQRPSSATTNNLGEFTPERPHFFKIILEESEGVREKKLLIPRRFVRIYGHDISTYVQVKDPSGRKWKLGWTKCDGETWFKNGWQEFVDFYSIVHGHVLVFEYDGDSQFSVVIFDKSATEIMYPVTRTHDAWENQDGSFQEVKMEETDQDELETEVSDDFTLSSKKGKKSPVNHSRTGSAKEFKGFSIDEKCKHRDVNVRTEQFKVNEKANAFKKAASFKSRNPFFSIVLQFSYVVPISARLRIPSSFYIDHITKGEGIAMLYSNGRRWDVKYLSNGRKEKTLQAMFGTGWKIFARENHLKVGDVCIFELINNINLTFKVHIHRVDESIDPCPSIRKRTQVADEKVVNKKPKTRDVQLKEDRIIESADRFSSKNPFFRVIMQPHYLSSPYLDIPIDFAEKHFKQVRKDVLLKVGRRSWTVQVFAPGRFCGGWSTFVKANSLQEKDVCIFELVETTSLVMKVHIFRGTDC